jgi:hypothetical protein
MAMTVVRNGNCSTGAVALDDAETDAEAAEVTEAAVPLDLAAEEADAVP